MPPARTTIPIRAVTNAPCDGALPLEICQSCTQQVQASALPIILLVEQQTESTPTLELAIAKTTGWSVIRVESSRDAVTTASLLGTQLKIVGRCSGCVEARGRLPQSSYSELPDM